MALVPKSVGRRGRTEGEGCRKGVNTRTNVLGESTTAHESIVDTTYRNNEPRPYQYVGWVDLNVSEHSLNIRLLQFRQLLRGRIGKTTHKQQMEHHHSPIIFVIYSYGERGTSGKA